MLKKYKLEGYKLCNGIGKGKDCPERFVQYIKSVSEICNLQDWELSFIASKGYKTCVCSKPLDRSYTIVNNKEKILIFGIGGSCLGKKILDKKNYLVKFNQIKSLIKKFDNGELENKDKDFIYDNDVEYYDETGNDIFSYIKKCVLCDEKRLNRIDFCKNHKCEMCNLEKKDESNYCKYHICDNCEKGIIIGSYFCEDHKCEECNLEKYDGSNFCIEHKCKEMNCQKNKLCDEHLYCTGFKKNGKCKVKYPDLDESLRCNKHTTCNFIKPNLEYCGMYKDLEGSFCFHHNHDHSFWKTITRKEYYEKQKKD